jgi:hypothetical protein
MQWVLCQWGHSVSVLCQWGHSVSVLCQWGHSVSVLCQWGHSVSVRSQCVIDATRKGILILPLQHLHRHWININVIEVHNVAKKALLEHMFTPNCRTLSLRLNNIPFLIIDLLFSSLFQTKGLEIWLALTEHTSRLIANAKSVRRETIFIQWRM